MADEAEREPANEAPMDQSIQDDEKDVEKPASGESWGENVKTVVYALAIALVLRTFLFQPFHIPTGSMIPTLQIGDYIFASKFTYGYNRNSAPFSPGFLPEDRLLGREPARGEIAVFKNPENERQDFIKRVIGVPGDTIQMRDSVLYINDEAVGYEFVQTLTEDNGFGGLAEIDVYRQTLPNGVEHLVYDRGYSNVDDTSPYFVAPGHYFMMGDNRDDSRDSRYFGAVTEDAFVGKAQIIFFSVNENFRLLRPWTWFNFRSNRFFHGLEAKPEEL